MAAAVTALFIAGLGVLAARQSGPGRLAVVVRDPESSIGTSVTVKGRVEEVVSAKSFTLTADDERIPLSMCRRSLPSTTTWTRC